MVASFRTKTLDYTLVIRLNWWEKIELRGCPWPPWSSILFIVNYCCTRVLMYAKTLKETENEETRLFRQIFVIGGILIEGAQAPRVIPLTTPMILRQDRSPKFFH